jgi:hypothetical protein
VIVLKPATHLPDVCAKAACGFSERYREWLAQLSRPEKAPFNETAARCLTSELSRAAICRMRFSPADSPEAPYSQALGAQLNAPADN